MYIYIPTQLLSFPFLGGLFPWTLFARGFCCVNLFNKGFFRGLELLLHCQLDLLDLLRQEGLYHGPQFFACLRLFCVKWKKKENGQKMQYY